MKTLREIRDKAGASPIGEVLDEILYSDGYGKELIRHYIGALLIDHEARKSARTKKARGTASGLQPRLNERAADLVRKIEVFNKLVGRLNSLVEKS